MTKFYTFPPPKLLLYVPFYPIYSLLHSCGHSFPDRFVGEEELMAGMWLLLTITHSSHLFILFMSAGPRVYGSWGREQVCDRGSQASVLWLSGSLLGNFETSRLDTVDHDICPGDRRLLPRGGRRLLQCWASKTVAEGGGAGGDQREGSNGDREKGGQVPRVRVLPGRGAVEGVRLLMLMKRWRWVHLSWKVLVMRWGRWRSLKVY